MNITCEDLVRHLSAYLDNELDADLSAAAAAHLATCDNCRVVLDSTQKTILLYREQGSAVQIPSGRRNRLYDQIVAAFSKRDDA